MYRNKQMKEENNTFWHYYYDHHLRSKLAFSSVDTGKKTKNGKKGKKKKKVRSLNEPDEAKIWIKINNQMYS